MSFAALAWATKVRTQRAADKLVLFAYADRHSEETGCAYPSIAWLCEFSSLDRKTVIASIGRLEAAGALTDSGDRKGDTKQVKVYRLNLETMPKTEPSQKRNSSEIPPEQSQKRDTDTVREPIPSEAKASSGKRAPTTFACPDGVDELDWLCLIDVRKAKRSPMNEGAYRQIIAKLKKWSDAGWPPGPIVAHAVERGWLTVFETDEMKAAQRNDRHPRQASNGKPNGIASALDRRIESALAAGETGRSDAGPGSAGGGRPPLLLASVQ